ncbi:endonuclease domain-containing protein [Streptomyces misionensis]|uniref:endonuclease domain-containing protein n=1 Tax=Streptomyces misionensis TaxID=67331 RepID=UPI0034255FCC
MRAVLVDALGPDCQLCGLYPGAVIDHDHESGLVRGLLCGLCNRVLEECPHLADCPRADYQNAPPAAGLGLIYPISDEWRTRDSTRQRKIALLGFDPFEGLPTRRAPSPTVGARSTATPSHRAISRNRTGRGSRPAEVSESTP